jgi:hypothetical protein
MVQQCFPSVDQQKRRHVTIQCTCDGEFSIVHIQILLKFGGIADHMQDRRQIMFLL